jgi:chemotaxis protein histidine kinase CheA
MNKLPESEAEPRSGVASASRQDRIVLALWEQSRDQLLNGLEVFERTAAALERAVLNDDLRKKAAVEAHKLIGSFGILRLREGSRLAAALEDLLNGPEIQKADPAALRDTVSTMRRMLTEGPQKS